MTADRSIISAADQQPRTQTVVVADDDAAVRSVLTRILGREGLSVITAADGARALQLIAESHPDLVLLDVIMPELDGLAVCRALKSQPETRLIPVVLLTGLDAREDRLAGIEAGADEFLSKPFDQTELIARVRSLLRVKRYTDELEEAGAVMVSLGRTVEERDPYTRGHCQRLAGLAGALGRRIGLPADAILDLERAGSLHDIGKIIVPDAILHKATGLTLDEWAVMHGHPEAGERICAGIRSLRTVLPIIRHHHERLDGSGYPDGLAGDEIPLGARILQIIDVYDALTTARPYKKALGGDEALDILETEVRRGWWDGELFQEFRAMMTARLDNGA